MSKVRRFVPWAVGMLGGLGGACAYRRYRADLDAAWERIESEGRVVQTVRGAIEYGEAGHGFPVLAIHGAGQGFDQALLGGQFVLGDNYRAIAPSRFGYLRSPVPEDTSPAAQADLLAALLDVLDVERAVVAAISAGGQSGIHFALRYPERTAALVLISAITCVPAPDGGPWRQRTSARCAVVSEFIYWLFLQIARPWLLASLGVSERAQAGWSAEERQLAGHILDVMLPLCARVSGYRVDRSMVVSPDVPLERIQAPTLVIHARDDRTVDWANGRQAAERIPSTDTLFFERGGHLLVGQFHQVRAGILDFLGQKVGQAS